MVCSESKPLAGTIDLSFLPTMQFLFFFKDYNTIYYLNSFIEVLIYKKLHIFNIYNFMSVDIGIHPGNHHYNLGESSLQKVSLCPTLFGGKNT